MLPAEQARQVRRIRLLARRAVQTLLGGEYQSVFKGSGLSFDEVREYQPGDDIRTIDWNVTARMGAPFVKRYVEERELTVILAADISRSLHFGTGPSTKRSAMAEIAALVAFSALANRDRVGLLAFAGDAELYLPASHGTRHALRILREVLDREPTTRGTSVAKACDYLSEVLPRRAIVFFLGDWQSSGYEASFRLLARKHDLIAVRVTDPRELSLPNVGLARFQDAETGQQVLLDTRRADVRSRFAEQVRDRRAAFDLLARATRTDVIDVGTDGDHLDELVRFFRARNARRRSRR